MTSSKTKVAVFGADAAEAAQVKRMDALMASGFDVQGFMMRRANMNKDFEPFWPNLHLYDTENENPKQRLIAVAKSIVKVARNRNLLRGTDVIMARNADMLMIGAIARMLTPGAAPELVYECLDINNQMLGQGLKNRVFRWVERRLLARTDTLIVSAPKFIENYFAPVQRCMALCTITPCPTLMKPLRRMTTLPFTGLMHIRRASVMCIKTAMSFGRRICGSGARIPRGFYQTGFMRPVTLVAPALPLRAQVPGIG